MRASTNLRQSTASENCKGKRDQKSFPDREQVTSQDAITLENNGKIRPQPDREKLFCRASGGGNATPVEPSLVDAALICKEFLNLRHVIECGLLSGLLMRPDRCRWPRWRCADRGQISESELEARRRFLVRPTRIMPIICPCSSCLPHNLVVRFEPRCRIRQRFRSPGRDSLRRALASPRCRAPSCSPAPRRPTSVACVPAGAPARGYAGHHGGAPSGSRPSRR